MRSGAEGLTISSARGVRGVLPRMAQCAKDVLDLTDSDVMLLAVSYVHGKKNPYRHVSVIGRAKPVEGVDLAALLRDALGGGAPESREREFPHGPARGDGGAAARRGGGGVATEGRGRDLTSSSRI